MPPAIQPLEKSAVRAAVKNVKEADYLIAWLEERQDAALFIGNVTKVANGKARLLLVTNYRVATFGFRQFQTPKYYEFELLQLLGEEVAVEHRKVADGGEVLDLALDVRDRADDPRRARRLEHLLVPGQD